MKTKVTLEALILGLTAIIIDADIVLFKDPLPYFNCSDCDIQIEEDVYEDNSGFYMARPTQGSIVLHQKAWAVAEEKGETISNQKVLGRMMESMSREKDLKINKLPMSLFSPGKVFFEDKMRMFFTDNPPTVEVLVHNNWIVTEAAKIYRFKEQLQWMVDTDGYYSDPMRKYLTYVNCGRSTETESLKAAMLIGHLLNRTVILPTFSCEECKYAACKVKSQKCSFNTHYKIASFDAVYKNQYREHAFLDHPLVPQSIRNGMSDTFIILTDSNKTKGETRPKNSQILYPKNNAGPTEEEILMWFSKIPAPVLQFSHLCHIYGTFKDKSYIKETAFNTKTDYRQY